MNAALLNSAETAIVEAMRLGHTIQIVSAEPIPAPAVSPFMAKMLALNGTNINRSTSRLPAAKVRTIMGVRGVFWAGYVDGEYRIGTCRITKSGHLHKFARRYDGAFFNSAAELERLNG